MKTIEELLVQNTELIADNNNREITEKVLRDHLADIIESSVNTIADDIVIIKKFTLSSNSDLGILASEINVKFYDYGKASVDSDGDPNTYNYDYVSFRIKQGGEIVHDGVLTNPPDNHSRLRAFIEDSSGFGSDESEIVVYINRVLPPIDRMDGRNFGFQELRGGRLAYRNSKNKTLWLASGDDFEMMLEDVWQVLAPQIALTPPSTADMNAVWMSGVSASMYVAIGRSDSRTPFGGGSAEAYGRKVYNQTTTAYENIGPNPTNNFANIHSKVGQIYVEYRDNGSYNIKDNVFKREEMLQEQSYVQFSLYRLEKVVGPSQYEYCYYILLKPIGLDIFDLSYFDVLENKLYAYLDDGYSTPIIRKVTAEDITSEINNRSYRVKKNEILRSNMMLNSATSGKSLNERGYKSIQFFYTDTKGKSSGFSPTIEVVNNKRGYTTGLLISNKSR